MFLNQDNQFTAKGRLTKNPITNISEKGNAVTSISLAVETPFKDENKKNMVAFIQYTAIDTKNNDIATRLAQYCYQGTLVSLTGYLDSYSKVDENGEILYKEIKKIVQFRVEESKSVIESREKERNNKS